MAKHTIRLSEANERDLKAICEREGKSPEAFMLEAIRYHLAVRIALPKTAELDANDLDKKAHELFGKKTKAA